MAAHLIFSLFQTILSKDDHPRDGCVGNPSRLSVYKTLTHSPATITDSNSVKSHIFFPTQHNSKASWYCNFCMRAYFTLRRSKAWHPHGGPGLHALLWYRVVFVPFWCSCVEVAKFANARVYKLSHQSARVNYMYWFVNMCRSLGIKPSFKAKRS